MKQTDPQFKIRLPPELRDQLEAAAASAQRTLGQEIVHRLRLSFADAAIPAELRADIDALVATLHAKWGTHAQPPAPKKRPV